MAWQEDYYRRAWDAVTERVSATAAAISHHHGIGLNRARFMADGPRRGLRGARVGQGALDPSGILNPGKLGLPTPFGEVALAVTEPGGSVLVVDVGTSGVRAAIVRPDATVGSASTTAASCPTPRPRGWSRWTPP